MTAGTPEPVLFSVTAGTVRRAVAWLRRALGWATYGYAAALLGALLALEWRAERLWVFSLLLYAPPPVLLAPLGVLTPLCALLRRPLCWVHGGCAAVLFFGYMTCRWHPAAQGGDGSLSAVTFNFGESNRPQFAAFLEAEKPDVILLQDARGYGPQMAGKVPGSFVAGHDQFVCVSKYPIQKSALLAEPQWAGHPVAARFEVLVNGQALVFYSVHLPTPRQELSRFLGGRRVLGDLVGRRHREPGFGNYSEWLAARIALAEALARVFAEEKEPFIVAGDFNMPDHGLIYHRFASEMTDAFAAEGRGWGLTFPGGKGRYVRLFGPWLRLDYFFAGRGWRAVECRPEPGGLSQHKAVLARFAPLPSK